MSISMEKKYHLNRRRALKIMGTSAGLSSIGIVTAGSSSDDTVQITIIETNDSHSENVTKEVPEDWYQFILRSREVASKLGSDLQSKKWFDGLTRASSSKEVAGKKVPRIEIESTNVGRAETSNDVPESKDDVDIEVVESSDAQPYADICNGQEYDCIPGGSIIRTEKDDGTDITRCSNTCQIQYNGEDHLMTAAHCFNACDEDPIGYHLKHGEEVVGEVVEYDAILDFAVVQPYSGVSISDSIISEDYSIIGHYTKDGIEDLRDNGETVSHYGSTTCKTQGEVDGISENWYASCGSDEFPRLTTHTDPGDSGGPHYKVSSTLDLVQGIGIICPLWGGSDIHSWGGAGYRIAEDYDITFGGSTCDGV